MTGPAHPRSLEQAPHGRTARRLDWGLLPPMLRREIESELGFPVAEARSAGAGFTPGLASVLVAADGRRAFVKAASTQAQRPFADAYREEARKLRALAAVPGLPVPRLRWTIEDDLWVVLGLEHVEGTNPARPWRADELERCLDTLERLGETLDPAPASLRLAPMASAEEFGGMVAGWDHVARRHPGWPRLDEARELAGRHADALAGDALVHTDARDDNFLLTPGGAAVLCDWNWPVHGPAWADTVMLLMSVAGEGHDADAVLARRRLTRDVDPEAVDVLLALVCGYFLRARDQPVPTSSPYLRRHQAWYAAAAWDWLAARRGWRRADPPPGG